jgi:hypothetical protein
MKLTRLLLLLVAFFSLSGLAAAEPIYITGPGSYTETFTFSGQDSLGWLLGTSFGGGAADIEFNFVNPNNTAFFDLDGQIVTPSSDVQDFLPSRDYVSTAIMVLAFSDDPSTYDIQVVSLDGGGLITSMPAGTNMLGFELYAPDTLPPNDFLDFIQDGIFISRADANGGPLYLTSASMTVETGLQTQTQVPEPGSLFLLSTGLLGVGFAARRKLLG